jgi:hypothetical protein
MPATVIAQRRLEAGLTALNDLVRELRRIPD